jgi:proteasome lid subunit RPN8/RPN11
MGDISDRFPRATFRISPPLIGAIERAVLAGYPEEACGLLLGTFRAGGGIRIEKIVQLPNGAFEERRRRYEIHPRLLLEWDRIANQTGSSIVGFFHSHPDEEPRPSQTDAKLAWPSYAYLIAGVSRAADETPIMNGLAAWTFDESSTSFRELKIEVEVGLDEIEYYI